MNDRNYFVFVVMLLSIFYFLFYYFDGWSSHIVESSKVLTKTHFGYRSLSRGEHGSHMLVKVHELIQ